MDSNINRRYAVELARHLQLMSKALRIMAGLDEIESYIEYKDEVDMKNKIVEDSGDEMLAEDAYDTKKIIIDMNSSKL